MENLKNNTLKHTNDFISQKLMNLCSQIKFKNPSPGNIVLIGFMGTGKSTVSSFLSELIQMEFIDTDVLIEKEANKSISKIFEEAGEAHFRKLECETVKNVSERDHVIISCGGGVVLNKENVRFLKKKGRIILLDATPEVIHQRIKDSDNLPVLKDRNTIEYIENLLQKRQPLYREAADFTIDTSNKSVGDVCNELLDYLLRDQLDQKLKPHVDFSF